MQDVKKMVLPTVSHSRSVKIASFAKTVLKAKPL